MTAATQAQKTQSFVPIKEIRNGIMMLKDGGYRGVLICSAVNLGLKSADEQQAITQGFQNFLNTLDFSIQILVNSRKMDLRPYLGFLEGKMGDQKSELMRIQLREYMSFIGSFADQTNIMTKSFYVIVSYTPSLTSSSASGFLHHDDAAAQKASGEETFERDREQLEQRLSLVAGGLSNMGVRAAPLGTEEIIELLYRSFNPGELENPIRLDA